MQKWSLRAVCTRSLSVYNCDMAPRTPRSELAAALARHRSGQIPEPHVAAAILHILSGAVVLALLPFVGSPRSPEAVGVVALVAITVGIAHLVFPWSELGQRATLWIIPESLALVVAFNLTYGDEVLYTTFFFVVWAWVGLAHPPGTAARFSPLLVIAYLLPVATPSITAADRSDIAASSIYVIPLCVAVAEIVAHVAQKLRESERRAGRSEARYASLMRHANEFVVVYDDRGRMQYVNAAFERMVGLTHEEDELVATHPVEADRGERGAKTTGHIDEEQVAHGVPEGIVDGLEVVDVEEQQRHRALGLRLVEIASERCTVGESGQ